jgi:hypothetical protein
LLTNSTPASEIWGCGRGGPALQIELTQTRPGEKLRKRSTRIARNFGLALSRAGSNCHKRARANSCEKIDPSRPTLYNPELGRFGREGRFANFAQTAGPFFAQDRIDTDAPGLKTVKRSTPLLRNRGCGRGGPASKIRPGSKILFGAKFFA